MEAESVRVPIPNLVTVPAPPIAPAKVSAFVLVTVTLAPRVSALLRVRLAMPGVRMALLKVTPPVPKELLLPRITIPPPVIVEDPKLLEARRFRVPAPFMESEEAVTLEAKVEVLLFVMASTPPLINVSALLTTSVPVPLTVKESAVMFDP